jgi:lysozyme
MNQGQIELLRQSLIKHEGVSNTAYQDSVGYWTIGVGRNIDKRSNVGLSDEEILYLLDNDIKRVQAELDKELPWWSKLDDVRKRVLAEMSFNLGLPRLLMFHNMLGAMMNGNFEAAADEMKDSRWYKQVGVRAEHLADAMRTGS